MDPIATAHGPNVSPPVATQVIVESASEAGLLVRSHVDELLDVTEWLLQAADDPVRAGAEWQTMEVALLRCGDRFSAIRVAAAIVFAAARSEDPARVDEYLAAALHGGPVFVDRQSGRYYCLVPVGACAAWSTPSTACLDAGSYLGVPHPAIDSNRYQARSSWCVPPDRPEAYCQADAVAQMVNVGRFRLAAKKEADGG
ncbi:hypothetical protein [Streptomyces cylindrosporus]|uniref:Uncharacterized protein n=1 Tax=Streptomyces cylindrosporus TaxID=2927583 RepID=A0ABS9Y0A8_9ACTN|nr:hypothetical protein [Streptomyces cylindrosporus]MCI3270116.1 hypothetical protein [Streptomyces cylindrosporus]